MNLDASRGSVWRRAGMSSGTRGGIPPGSMSSTFGDCFDPFVASGLLPVEIKVSGRDVQFCQDGDHFDEFTFL